MNDQEFRGKLVYLTVHVDRWFREAHPDFNVPLSNRLAKIIKVFDWETKEGKMLLAARNKNGKWGNLNSRDFKFVLKVYHPDLVRGRRKGLTVDEVLPRHYPGTELLMFDTLPRWILSDFTKVEKDAFKVAAKSSEPKKKPKTTVKKHTKLKPRK